MAPRLFALIFAAGISHSAVAQTLSEERQCKRAMDEWYRGDCNFDSVLADRCKGLAASAAALSNTSYSIDDRELWSSSSTPFPGLSDWTFIDDVRVDRADGIFGSSAVDGFVVLYLTPGTQHCNTSLGYSGAGGAGAPGPHCADGLRRRAVCGRDPLPWSCSLHRRCRGIACHVRERVVFGCRCSLFSDEPP